MKKTFEVAPFYEKQRVDVFISSVAEITRSHAKKLCDDGNVSVCGKIVKSNKLLKCGDEVEVLLPEPETAEVVPENIPIDIVYQDGDIAVINKPQGLTVHAGQRHGQ